MSAQRVKKMADNRDGLSSAQNPSKRKSGGTNTQEQPRQKIPRENPQLSPQNSPTSTALPSNDLTSESMINFDASGKLLDL